MNDATLRLLEKLAEQFGTTAAHLWGVMLRQAYISAVTDIMQYAVIALTPFIMLRVHRFLAQKIEDTGEEEWAIGMFLGWAAVGILLMICFFCIPNTVTKIVNPEYWALSQILGNGD